MRSTLRLFATGILILLFSAFSSNSFGQLTFTPEGTTAVSGPGYDLTPTVGGGCFYQTGALWCTTTLDFSQPFELNFQAKFNPTSGSGADGICVVFGQMGTSASPVGTGGGLGYYSSSPSIFSSHSFAIELDIFDNGAGADDIAADHTTVTKNADITTPLPGASPVQIDGSTANVKDNTFRNYKVVWSPATQTLLFYCNCKLRITSHYNYAGIFSTPTAVDWGFTSSTGGFCAQQYVQGITTSIPTVPTFDTSLCGSSLTLIDTASGPLYYWLPDSATTSSITATATGTYSVISYDTASCLTSSEIFHVTLNPVPAISGPSTVCTGNTIALTTTVSGGTWSSSNPAVGSVGSASGIVTGVSPGVVTITYTTAAGCTASHDVTVNLSPTISGTFFMCAGSSVTLTGTPAGGTWSTGSSAISVGSASGVVTGLSASTPLVTYTLPDGCPAIQAVTVNPVPFLLSPVLIICVGGRDTLSASLPGIAWSSSNPAVASVAALGTSQLIVTGVTPGTAVISYTVTATGCSGASTVTVNPDPVITGTLAVCAGSTTSLSATPPGGTWSSDAAGVATVGSTGIVTGVAAGTAHIGYVVPGAGCFTFKTVTVNTTPIPYRITVPICVGETFTAASLPTGGTWTSSNTAIATVGSATALVTGTGVGVAHITYTLPVTGCFMTFPLTVNAAPAPLPPLPPVCVGSSETLTDAVPGGVWSSSVTTTATIGSASGFATGVAAGVTTITYATALGATCYVTGLLTVNTAPVITGPDSVCVASNITLSGSPSGGTWSPATGTYAIISASGVVTGTSSGVATITYTLPSGCTSTYTITVNALPPAIEGLSAVCVGDAVTLHDPVSGTWSSGSAHVSVGSTTGGVTGLSAGGAIITFTSSAGGCITTEPFTVNPLPAPISGPDTVCPGATVTLTDATRPGTFSGGTPGIATISSSGTVTGISTGTTTVTYTVTATGCFRDTTITVLGTPVVSPITGFDSVCVGDTTIFSDAYPGGVWTSTDPSVATVSPITGSGSASCYVIGVSPGVSSIEYTVTNMCGASSTVQKPVTVLASPVPPPITGAPGVCAGSTDTLRDAMPGGTWTSSDPTIAAVGPASGIVTGIATGMVEITYTVTNLCGTGSAYKTIAVNMPPYITTNAVLACHSYGDYHFGEGYSLPDSGCHLVCDSSIDRYYANGVSGSHFTWVVAGGIIIHNYGDSIDVLWPTVGITATITLYDTADACTGFATGCIQVIEKPHAAFSASAVNVCLDGNVIFTDSSTADTLSPIASWRWDFGDGGYASVENPAHVYTAAGTYTVTLVVKNECGCADTVRSIINVSSFTGPSIICPSIVCDSEVAVYNATGGCGSYTWAVTGGTVVSGLGTSTLTVKWDGAAPSGMGHLYLAEPCTGGCPDTAAIQVPVILQSPSIDGPDVICAGHPYTYSLPLWAATQYMWGVIGDPGAIRSTRTDHNVLLTFDYPGTYTIHGWYQNRLKLCGANIDKTITVVLPTSISGSTTVCQDAVEKYTIASPFTANWTLYDLLPDTVIATGRSDTFTHVFSAPGMYLLSGTGPFCANPITITVLPLPDSPLVITGPDTICLGRVYTYVASMAHRVPGAVLSWSATGGTVIPSSGSDTVNVIWTAGGTKQLNVSWLSTTAPFCSGPAHSLAINQEIINPDVTGDTLPCANAFRNYNCNYRRAEVYDWLILPATAGSVTAGAHDTAITVQWNNVSAVTAASVIVKVRKCDSVISDTLNVNIQPTLPPVLIASRDTVCPLDSVQFTVSSGDSVYVWNFGDGSAMATTTDTFIRHAFPLNTTTGNIIYTVRVTGIPVVSYACPPAGTSVINVAVLPGPVAFASTGQTICPGDTSLIGHGDDSARIVGTVTGNVSGLTYQWYYAPVSPSAPVAGATDTSYETYGDTGYYFVVTASNGCTAMSNIISVPVLCPGDSGCATHSPITSSVSCRTIHLNGVTGSTFPQWTDVTDGYRLPPGVNITVVHDTPGIYVYQFTGEGFCTTDPYYMVDTIGFVPEYIYRIKCGTGTDDTIFLSDHTAFLPFFSIGTITWRDASGVIATGANLTITRARNASYAITEQVTGTGPSGTYTCDTTMNIVLPGPPHVSFTDSVSPICEGIAVQFNSIVTGGVLGYDWSFGDSAYSTLPNPKRTFSWSSLYTDPSHPFSVTLTVTDSVGCSYDTAQPVVIFHNNLRGAVAVSNPLIQCSTAPPIILLYSPIGSTRTPVSYLWSTGSVSSSISVSQTGSYWVTVTDIYGCQQTVPNPVEQVHIIPTPSDAHITGQWNYCFGEAVSLSGYDGSGVSYEWLRDGAVVGADSVLVDPGLPTADYLYQLIVSVTDAGVTCADTASQTVHMYSLPAPPTITGPTVVDCGSYHLQLTASEPVDGTYNWSDGAYGATDNIFAGGPYQVKFTNLFGCKDSAEVTVPYSDDYYFQYFPSGCYALCTQQLPLTLYGPPGSSFTSWAWLVNGATALSGSGAMSAYAVDTDGSYQWSIDNGLCAQTSAPLSITTEDCNKCNDTTMSVTLTCDASNPASYGIAVTFTSPAAGTAYTIGTDIGPIDPFSGTLSSAGSASLTLTFTTLYIFTLPDSVTVQISLTLPDGSKCFLKKRVPLPVCTWVAERGGHAQDNGNQPANNQMLIVNSLLVYPNPTTGNVTVSYDYGTVAYSERSLSVFNAVGNKIASVIAPDVHGTWNINADSWSSGIYIIRMEADGKALQTQRMVVIGR